VTTRIGEATGVVFSTPFDDIHHLALVFGDVVGNGPVPVRLHRENVVSDVFGRSPLLEAALDRISSSGSGVIVYLREGGAGVPPQAWPSGPEADGGPEGAVSAARRAEEWRDIGLGAQILRDLDLTSIRLITNRERTFVGLAGFGIEIASTDLVGEPDNPM
jgi:3,4-dihydroxy 2-butanone 4-phosphate synthase/GTP cyclohydrolase II